MFALPALLYLKVLPLFGQYLYHLIVPNKSRPPHAGGALPAGPLPDLHPFWVGRASVGIFAPHQRQEVWPPTYDLACNMPHTRWIFRGIGFRTWNPPAPKPIPCH
ncbi:hypothetical protein AVEN_248987-1 [Araneus ventricosus]|uniref:Uncharacterized protein n=1 Tax=Araneus ventricosus TaxID=182803 RepID=A0A4Y1ZX74_ARAVE|nr:hypothetical protein AVEN_248987-1 [Araneus ventricosus]